MKLTRPAILHKRMPEHLALVGLVVLVAALVQWNDLLWRADNLLYDAQLSLWSRPAAENIVIIAIDDKSLEQLGRWPWPRERHARLLRQLQKEQPAAIGLDMLFSEPDRANPESDAALAAAIRHSGKVVLPVYMSQSSARAVPLEALPIPALTRYARALGHVNLDISPDGIARQIYLREGIDKPHWPHYAVALLQTAGKLPQTFEFAADSDTPTSTGTYSPMRWSREYPYLIPYAGPPGHFTRIGYSQVLEGVYPRGFFRDKIVLVGTTAEGMGDAFPTPLSGHSHSMPGVEIVANVADALQNGLSIQPLQKPVAVALSLLLIALPLLVYPYVKPASTLATLFGFLLSTLLLVALMLWLFSLWLPAATILLFQILGYPLWSWRRLDLAMRHINQELDQLSSRQQQQGLVRRRNLAAEIRFLRQYIDIKSWVLIGPQQQPLAGEGTAPRCNLARLSDRHWSVDGHRRWAQIEYQGQCCQLGLSLAQPDSLDPHAQAQLDALLEPRHPNRSPQRSGDLWQDKVAQLKIAGDQYQQLRILIDDSLNGMADGLLICDGRGNIMLHNRRAAWYLAADDDAPVSQQPLLHWLEQLTLKDGDQWPQLLQQALFQQQRQLARSQHRSGRDLMIEISPLKLLNETLDGFIINLSDISLLKRSERQRNRILDFLSHDLRSPLSSMLAMIELARDKNQLSEVQAMLDVMEKNTEKTLHLAEQFLQLSRASTDEKIQFYEIDFINVALNAIDQMWALANNRQIRLETRFELDQCWTLGEGDMLERALVNLLSNAIKHSPDQSEVVVQISLSGQEICCCVIDHGCGIAKEEIPHLFELFKRVQGQGVERIQGIGLGLAFVEAVAKRHQGHVMVDSQPGKGSRFCLLLPQREPADHDADAL